jgi:hypothetical protein
MSSASSNPAAPGAHTIGKSGQDATEPSALQGDSSCVSSSIESVKSPLIKSSAAEPARRSTQDSRPVIPPPRTRPPPRRAASGAEKLPLMHSNSRHALLQSHQLGNHRLEELGQVMPLKERLHCLQTGHNLSGFQHAVKKYVDNAHAAPVSRLNSHGTGIRNLRTEPEAAPPIESQGGLIAEAWDDSLDALDYEQEAQMRFNLYVEEYTTSIDLDLFPLPADLDIPECECDEPCALRSHNDPQCEGTCLWVCASSKCMVLEDTSIVFNAGFSTRLSDLSMSSDSDTEADQYKSVADQLRDSIVAGDSDAFCSLYAGLAIELPTDAEQTLTRNLRVPECYCQEIAQTVIDKVTGGIFFVCRNRACYFVSHCAEELPDIGKMDIGQFLGLGDSILDKYTNLQYGMRWFGYTFSKRFWSELSHQPTDSDYHHGAFQLEPGEEYTGFLSYRGGSGRWYIQTTLCGEFNTAPAFYFMVVFCPIVALGLSFIPDVCESSNASSWEWLVFSDGCSYEAWERSWFIFRSYGRSILAIIILFWHPIFSWFYRGQKLFIDKYCIHQSDMQGRTVPGVTRLPLFLQHSQKMLVLFDSEYTTRLWCVFELAVYLRLRKDPKVVFISMDKRFLGVEENNYIIISMFSVTRFEQSRQIR